MKRKWPSVNSMEGFSGGEKKRNGNLAIVDVLEPTFALLDEIDLIRY